MTILDFRKKKGDNAKVATAPPEGASQPLSADTRAIAAPNTGHAGGKNDAEVEEGLLDSETGEPLLPGKHLEEFDETGWPGEIDNGLTEGERRPDEEPELTEDYIAKAFIDRHGQRLRYDHDIGSWYGWSGAHWSKDETKATFDMARSFCRAVRGGARAMSSKRAIEGVEIMASRDPRVGMTTRDWNKDPWVLGTPDGYVDLKTGESFDADPDRNVSQLTSVAPAERGTPTPHFDKFLDDVTQGDPEVRRFLQQYVGYCLTGVTREQVLLFIYGPGGNGKSVLQNVVNDVMGDYAKTAAMDTFSATRQPRHLTEIAMLRDARLVSLSETEKGQRWSQARLNQMTGGDNITANFMRQDMFTYRPVFKTFVVGNHKPHLTSVNEAERRRFLIVPFLHKPASPDKQLSTKLRDEHPGILRWAIEGCLDWLENGLLLPEVVKDATKEYFESEDLLGRWVEECCQCGPNLKAKAKDLWESFRAFAEACGEPAGTMKAFSNALGNGGFSKMKSGVIVYLGLNLIDPSSVDLTDVSSLQAHGGEL